MALTLEHNGVEYRTKLIQRDQAERFAACLRANPLFTGVMVYESDRAKHETRRWFVIWHPANPARLAELVAGVQSTQDDRATAQWENYLVVRADRGSWFHLLNFDSGETYEAHPDGGCDCPHYEGRLRAAGIACKHSGIIRIHLALNMVRSWAEATSTKPAPRPIPDPENGADYWPPFEEQVAPFDPAAEKAARRAEIARTMARDFPEF